MFCCMFKHAGAQVSKKHQKFLNLVIPTKPLSLSVVSILAWLSWDRLLLPRPCGPNLREEHPLCSKTSPNSNLPCPWPPKSMSPVFYCNWTVTQNSGYLVFQGVYFLSFFKPWNNEPLIINQYDEYSRCLFTWLNKWHQVEPQQRYHRGITAQFLRGWELSFVVCGTEECHEMTWKCDMKCGANHVVRIWWDHKATNNRRVS